MSVWFISIIRVTNVTTVKRFISFLGLFRFITKISVVAKVYYGITDSISLLHALKLDLRELKS